MDSRKKSKTNYDRVMSRVFSRSRTSVRSNSTNVTRHEVPSSVRLPVGAKPSVSAVSSSVFSELPTVLNDYVPDLGGDKVVKRPSVKPRRTLKSLDPCKSKSPPRVARGRGNTKDHGLKARSSASAVLSRNGEEWSESHVRQCYSSRSHTRLKELKDEIKAFRETDKLMKLRSNLYKRCGVVLDDVGNVAEDKAVQADPGPDKEDTSLRRLQWLELIGREDLTDRNAKNYYVCNVHFKDQDIKMNISRKTLKKNAAPCLHLPGAFKQDKETQTEFEAVNNNNSRQSDTVSDDEPQVKSEPDSDDDETLMDIRIKCERITETDALENSPRIKSEPISPDTQMEITIKSENITRTHVSLSDTTRKRKLNTESSQCKKLKQDDRRRQTATKSQQQALFDKLCNRFLSKNLTELVKAQRCLKQRKGNKYTLAYKMFCIQLYHVSPQAYRLLANTICLPSRNTVNKMYIPISTEVNEDLMAALKLKVNKMSDKEKECTLVAGAMRLKTNLFYDIKNDKIIGFHEVDGVQSPTPATYAVVLMVQGIYEKWSRPIGFSLVSECKNANDISKWIDKIITKLFEIGLNIRAFVSDVESDLFNAAKERGISVENPYFIVNDHKIYYIFDAPQLIKLVRNNLMSHDFHFHNGDVAKFEHIVKFYEFDQKRTIKLTKLTSSHMNPNKREKMKIRYATQLLSRSVASGLSTCIDFGIMDESARQTVKLIIMMNDLFDVLNSSSLSHSYSYKNAYCGDDRQINFFNYIMTLFESLKVINLKKGCDVTETVKFIEGFQITIQAIMLLFQDLNQNGYNYLMTRRLNQDILDNFFGKIRAMNVGATEPTSRQFISAYRKLYFTNIMQAPKEVNCEEDLTKFLDSLKEIENVFNKNRENENLPTGSDATENNLHEILRSDYLEFDIPEKNAFLYVCGALLKKCIDHHNECDTLQSYVKGYYKNHAYKRNLLAVPPADFVNYIQQMEHVFQGTFKTEYINSKIGATIFSKIKDLQFILPCACFPKIYLQKLFVRMRIYISLSMNHKAFRTCRNRRKHFSVANL